MDMPKAYNAKEHEDRLYKEWEEGGFFHPETMIEEDKLDAKAEPFSLMMPPPNVTGVLHLGHALENSIMDVMVRFKRMQGRRAVLVPGTDHAAVATQARVEKDLIEAGMKKPREELGREGLLEKIREYAEESKGTILSQIRKMGTSCDWKRLAYTFDHARSEAVSEIFSKMHGDGLIYRGHRVVNWSVAGQSTCSDDELVHVEREAKLYTFKYSKDFPFAVATTRPETKLGDTAVAVHPDDERYKKYVGQTFEVDFAGAVKLKLKIVADKEVDPEFGTGTVGVTPAHSMVDFDMKERHNLELVEVIDSSGKMTANAGQEYEGLSIEEARAKLVAHLEKEGLIEKVEDITQNVGTSDRFGDAVEVIPMTQWFVDVNKEFAFRQSKRAPIKGLEDGEAVTLKKLMGHVVRSGQVSILPDRFDKTYFHWIDNLRDWCISRQVWWGHQIPVWYKGDETFVGDSPEGEGWEQDPDTLDTWFSSGTWTFSTLGWPDGGDDLEAYHPTNWMQMGYEIIFFWMARMILMSAYALGEVPFRDVYIHGMVRDKTGQKFSKSLRNTVDPLEMIEKYGTDALRLSMLMGVTPGNDVRFYEDKAEHYRNFVNKLWNVSRYVLTSVGKVARVEKRPKAKTAWDEWILSRLDEVTSEATDGLEKFEFARVGEMLYDFTWHDFADWYLEVAKVEGKKDEILLYVLERLLKLWNPYIPFVTELIWEFFGENHEKLIIQPWPTSEGVGAGPARPKGALEVEQVKEIIVAIRSARAAFHVPPAQLVKVVAKKDTLLKKHAEVIKRLARVESVEASKDRPEGAISIVVADTEMFLPVGEFLDLDKEKSRLSEEIEELKKYDETMQKKLKNKQFIKNAKPEVVEDTKKRKEEAEAKRALIENQLSQIS